MFKATRSLQVIAATLVVLILAVPVLADSYLRSLSITQPTKLGATELKPGEYTLFFDGSKIVIKQGKKIAAEAAGEWADVSAKSTSDAVIIDNGKITEVRIGGKTKVIKVKS